MIKYYLIRLSKLFSLIFTLFPIRSDRILLYSFSGKSFSDSPMYITEYILGRNDKFEIIWAFHNPAQYRELVQRGIRVIKYGGILHFYYGMTAKFIITNTGPFKALHSREGQYIINTWHGGGAYKKTGMDNPYKDKYRILYNKNFAQDGVKLFLSSSDAFTAYAVRGAFGYEGNVANVGLPRNDILLNQSNHKEISSKVREGLSIKSGEKIVLFAPTWRNYEVADFEKIDCNRVLDACEKRFGGKWRFLFRGHNLSRGITASVVDNLVNATDYPDMQELLIAADVLISDYSSCIWDFSLLYKPCFLFTPDLLKYDSVFSFYTPIEKWGFPVCRDNDLLEEQIIHFDSEEFHRAVDGNHQFFGECETGKACEFVYNYICANKDEV